MFWEAEHFELSHKHTFWTVTSTWASRNPDKSYECLFNETRTAGKWLNSSVVQCVRPAQLSATQPYSVVLLPVGLQRVVKTTQLFFFHLYEECTAAECAGHCFQGFCVCAEGFQGPNCEQAQLPSSLPCPGGANDSLELEAEEMQPFSYLLAPNVSAKVLQGFGAQGFRVWGFFF